MASSIRLRTDRTPRLALALVVLVLAPALLGAKARPPKKPVEVDPVEAQARAEFQRGVTAYNLGQFEDAAKAYAEAYRLKPLPGFLFNLGQCERQLGRLEKAAFFFRRFLELMPASPNAPTARQLLEEVEARRAAEKQAEARQAEGIAAQAEPKLLVVPPPPALASDATPTAPASNPEPTVEAPLYKKWWLWTLVGVVVVGAAAGTAVAVSSQSSPSQTSLGTLDAR